MYRVVIEVVENSETEKREWVKLADTGNEKDNGPTYGYATYKSTQQITRKVFEQTVEAMDIWLVVKAVNGGVDSGAL